MEEQLLDYNKFMRDAGYACSRKALQVLGLLHNIAKFLIDLEANEGNFTIGGSIGLALAGLLPDRAIDDVDIVLISPSEKTRKFLANYESARADKGYYHNRLPSLDKLDYSKNVGKQFKIKLGDVTINFLLADYYMHTGLKYGITYDNKTHYFDINPPAMSLLAKSKYAVLDASGEHVTLRTKDLKDLAYVRKLVRMNKPAEKKAEPIQVNLDEEPLVF